MFPLLQYKDNIAVITENGERLTYAQLFEETELLKNKIPYRGLICCLCTNTVGSLIGYVSGFRAHTPLILLDGERDNQYIDSYIQKHQPEYLWLPSDKHSVFKGAVIHESYGYSLIQMDYGDNWQPSPLNEELCLCLTTSGSTGSPKLVRLTEYNLKSNAESIAEYLKIDESERPITTLPMYYSFGMSVINSHLIKGATILLTGANVFSKVFWDFFKKTSPTSIAGVPFTYEMLEKMGLFQMELPSLKTMLQAGGKLNPQIVERYVTFATETRKEFVVMYGQTEAGPRMSYLPFDKAHDKPSSIGIPIPGGEFNLYDANDKQIYEANVEGELVFVGPSVCMGYAEERADLAKDDENHGILKTGDVAYHDEDGYYYITGRLKRFVKIWGNRYNLDAIEQLVKPITSNCACVGNDEAIFVYIEDSCYVDNISQVMSKTLKLNKSCYRIKVIDCIPKAPSGKIDYPALKEQMSF